MEMRRNIALFAVALAMLWFVSKVKIPLPFIYQPGPNQVKDMFYSSVYDYGTGHIINNEKLRVGGWGDDYWTFIQFDLSALPANAKKVELIMMLYNEEGMSTPMEVFAVTTPWDETAGWTGYEDELGTKFLSRVEAPPREGTFQLDITGLYNRWKGGAQPNYGIVFKPLGTNHQFNTFRSSEYMADPSARPKLIITPL